MVERAWEFIWLLPSDSFLLLFWLTILIEVPRYFIGMQAVVAAMFIQPKPPYKPLVNVPPVSILLVGLNEEESVELCVRSLHQQTFNQFEIIAVSDGSTDATVEIMQRLQREGLIRVAIGLQVRGGKPAGINLAAHIARGEILVITDCDCSFEPNAIEELIRPLVEDPSIAAVSGNILVRNWRHSVATALQGIEYLVSISLGKSFSNIIDQVVCISGAFGAFRRDVWDEIGGQDAGGGEDFDYTMRLRLAGYKTVFVRESICYTDVPETVFALLKQRGRWERDTFWLRMRKYGYLFNPFSRQFYWYELIQQLDFLLFTLIPTVMFPFYIIWLLTRYGDFGLMLLLSVLIFLSALDFVVFACALIATKQPVYWRLLWFVPLYGVFQSYVMRLQRFHAYANEWIFSASLKDNYTPVKTRQWHMVGRDEMVETKQALQIKNKRTQSLARRIYLGMLLMGGGWVFLQIAGPILYLDADGLVMQDRKVVGTEYTAQVLSITARPGDKVTAGQQIGTVVSTQMLDMISELNSKIAQLNSRREQIDARLVAIYAMRPAAQQRSKQAEVSFIQVQNNLKNGMSTVQRLMEASREHSEGTREFEGLNGESTALSSERQAVLNNLSGLKVLLASAKASYHDGIIKAPVSGIVGPKVTSPGTVLKPGEAATEVYYGEYYVIAYLPTNRLYGVHPDDSVVISDGQKYRSGRIVRVEALADALPPEYQSNFRSVERRQVVRVVIQDSDQSFPLLAKINVTDVYAPSSLTFASWRRPRNISENNFRVVP